MSMSVKPLMWGKTSYGTPEVETIAGVYRLNNAWNGGWTVSRNKVVLQASNGLTNFATEEEAKEAGEANYRARILSALEPQPEDDPVAWQWSDFSGRWHSVEASWTSVDWQEGVARSFASEHEGRVRPLYAHPTTQQPVAITDEMVEPTTAARFARLYGICRRILWTDASIPALDNVQTEVALEDLAEFMFMDGIDAAMEEAK